MVYKVIGLMSGSSHDGLDIAYVQLEETRGQWKYELLATDCAPYTADWQQRLKQADQLSVPDFLRLHTAYGHYIGEQVAAFMLRHDLAHKVHFIASHGHTVFHDPAEQTTFQVGDGAAIAAKLALPVISDLRAMDIALGGQGAPIVPIGDQLLFGDYDYLLNLGGIANISVKQQQGQYLAFDICPCNQLLDFFAGKNGLAYDAGGQLAGEGTVFPAIVSDLNGLSYYQRPTPKSLSNDFSTREALPLLEAYEPSVPDALATCTAHITQQIALAIQPFHAAGTTAILLATGGGALNTFLITKLQELLAPQGITVVVPDEQVIQYKEALVMALIGALRWREEVNVFSSVTGATQDSVGGALWMR